MDKIKEILLKFRDERDWFQFHDPKNLAEAISIEAGELLELFLWRNKEEVNKKIKEDKDYEEKIAQELADVFIFCFQMCNTLDFDAKDIIFKKIEKNRQKYPVEKARGNFKKYSEF